MLVPRESLERCRAEYGELVQKILANSRKSRSPRKATGDLRENHEFKAAKEMQKILMRQRRRTSETQLMRARAARTFQIAKTDAVNIGTIAQATNLETNQSESFTILGAWDSDPGYGHHQLPSRPSARRCSTIKPGDEVEFELHGTKRRQRIEKIEAWKTEAPAQV